MIRFLYDRVNNTLKNLCSITANSKKGMKLWCLMIWPKVIMDFTLKLGVIIFPIADIDNSVVVRMAGLQEIDNLFQVISVNGLKAL